MAVNGFQVLPVHLRHALHVSTLSDHHGNPFDRILAAQARESIQARHPDYDDLRIDRALFRQIYGEALFRKVFPGVDKRP